MKLRYKIFFLSLFFFLFGIQFTVSAQQAYGPPQAGGPSPPGNYSSGQGQRGGGPPNNIRPTAVSEVPAEINFDFASNRGEFSRYLFTVVDSPYPLEELSLIHI